MMSKEQVVAMALLASGCTHTVPIAPERLPEVLSIADGASIELEDGERTYVVGPGDAPRLLVEREADCVFLGAAFDPQRCARTVSVAIADVRADDDALRFYATFGPPIVGLFVDDEIVVPRERVRGLALQFDDPQRRPQAGIGISVLGPSRLVGLQGQWLPVHWLGLDGGLAGAPELGGFVWMGARWRPLELGLFRPFLGAAVSYGALEQEDGVAERELAIGPRLGTDLDLGRQVVLTLEADLYYRPEPRLDWLDSSTSAWLPTGGASVSYLF